MSLVLAFSVLSVLTLVLLRDRLPSRMKTATEIAVVAAVGALMFVRLALATSSTLGRVLLVGLFVVMGLTFWSVMAVTRGRDRIA